MTTVRCDVCGKSGDGENGSRTWYLPLSISLLYLTLLFQGYIRIYSLIGERMSARGENDDDMYREVLTTR